MNRYTAALNTLGASVTLSGLVETLLHAVREAEVEQVDPCSDAAVMLLGSQVAFMTHADVTTAAMFDTVVTKCETKQNEALVLNVQRH